MTKHPVWPGQAYPLGATLMPDGVNFAIFAEHATSVDICLFDSPEAPKESSKLRLTDRTDGVWHGFIPGLKAGQLYGVRTHGSYKPTQGHRFNAAKLLLDPYARAIPECVVVDGGFDWGDDARPNTPLADSVIYELHVRGFSKLHPLIPENV